MVDGAAIDLQLRHWHSLHIGHQLLTGAEVVDRPSQTDVAQRLQGDQRTRYVVHRPTFGDPAAELVQGQTERAGPRVQLSGKVGIQ
jgi:hypothetical protein